MQERLDEAMEVLSALIPRDERWRRVILRNTAYFGNLDKRPDFELLLRPGS